LGGGEANPSPVGIAVAAVSLMVMPFLSWAQRRTGRRLGSATVVADSSQTLLCTYLSAVLLAGLALNAAFGWWWADALVGLVVAGLAVREGRAAWRGEACTCVPVAQESGREGAGDEVGGCSAEGCAS
jgi:divalent metal cation (Fe/Co/Zn/Cd) transporter